MSLEFTILGSGSSGNSTLVRLLPEDPTRPHALLIDAGFGPRATAKRLAHTHTSVTHISAICLTHLDHDHFNVNWLATLCKLNIRVYCHASRTEDLFRRVHISPHAKTFEQLVCEFDNHPFEPLPGLQVTPIPFAHDTEGSHGFILQTPHHRAGYATDLGHVPKVLLERFADLDFIALESNYDPEMEKNSDRPWYLKHRIMDGFGHLSNNQAFEAIQNILDRTEKSQKPLPQHIVLLHRSQQCNCPKLLRNLFSQDPRIPPRLTLSDQHLPTSPLRLSPVTPPPPPAPPPIGVQIPLFELQPAVLG